jgi:hypothetical protein
MTREYGANGRKSTVAIAPPPRKVLEDNAWVQLNKLLGFGERLEAIVFGDFRAEEVGIPADRQGIVLSPEQARPFMLGWGAYCGFGGAGATPFFAWSNDRVFWVSEYDGACSIASVPRHPMPCKPEWDG